MSETELLAQRRQTSAFIEANSVEVIVNRPQQTRAAHGGYERSTPEKLAPQRVRLTPWSGSMQIQEIGGATQENLSLLIADYEADLIQDDYFVVNGQRYDVVWVDPDRSYRVAAGCARKGVSEEDAES